MPQLSLLAERKPGKPSAAERLRALEKQVRQLIADDQNEPEMVSTVCEILTHVERQLGQAAGLQELFEWYAEKPTL